MELDLENGTVIPKLREWEKTALIYGGLNITYRELTEKIKSLAHLLDITPDERIIIICENRPEWVYALFAVWQRGGVVVPVDFMSSPQELEYILREVEPSAIFFSDTTQNVVTEAVENLGISPQLFNFDSIALSEKKT